jgi:hypothetical protein
MHELADLLQKSSTDWLEVSELYREMGDFSNSLNVLGAHSGRKSKLHASIHFLIGMSVSSPARYVP